MIAVCHLLFVDMTHFHGIHPTFHSAAIYMSTVNPLSPSINMHLLLSVLHVFRIVLVGRI